MTIHTRHELITQLETKLGSKVVSIKHDDTQGPYSTFIPWTVVITIDGVQYTTVGRDFNDVYERFMWSILKEEGTPCHHGEIINALTKQIGGLKLSNEKWQFTVMPSDKKNFKNVNAFHIESFEKGKLVIWSTYRKVTSEKVEIKNVDDAIKFTNNYR